AGGLCRLVVPPDVLHIRGNAVRYRVWPADPLKLGRDLAVVQIGMVAAVAADDLIQVRVAAFRPAFKHAGRLAAQNHRPAVPALITGRHACLLSEASTRPPRGGVTGGPAARAVHPQLP